LEGGAIQTLIVWENLEIMRYVLKNPNTGGICDFFKKKKTKTKKLTNL